MILFYAYGSGLGHLNRILSYIQVKKIVFSSCIIITNSKHKKFLPSEIKMMQYSDVVFKNLNLFEKKLTQIIEKYVIKEFVVDVFPCGFHGELQKLERLNVKKIILARILKSSYFEQYSSPFYDELVVFEKGIILENYTYASVNYLSINEAFKYSKEKVNLKKPFFFIIHSEPVEEVLQLYKLAKLHQKKEEHIYIQTFCTMPTFNEKDVTLIFNKQPILSLLENSEKIFTACGFNLFFATEKYRQKQYFLPFERRYDDQFKRKAKI